MRRLTDVVLEGRVRKELWISSRFTDVALDGTEKEEHWIANILT